MLPIAKEFKQRLPNYLPDWSLASGAMLIRVTVGRLGTRSLKKIRQESQRDAPFRDEARHIPAAIKAAATRSVACLLLARFKTC